jgi:TATA-box binding protein (TBP) (component of TFIID and TFIIIB)
MNKRKRSDNVAVTNASSTAKKVKHASGFDIPKLQLISDERLAAIRARVVGPIIFNVVCVAHCNEPKETFVDQRARIAWLCDGKQNMGEFAAPCQLPLRDSPYTLTLCIFGEGKMVITGAAHEHIARKGLWTALYDIGERTGVYYTPKDFGVVNVHSTVYMNCSLDLPAIHDHLPESVYIYDFINMVKIKLREPKVTCLVYKTGSLVLTGASDRRQLVTAMHIIVPFLSNFVIDFNDSKEEEQRIQSKMDAMRARLMAPTADL